MNKYKFRIFWNILIAAAVAVSWLSMTFSGKGSLTANGLGSLKYFTMLSNILEGIASVVWLSARKGSSQRSIKAERFKLVAAASVMLTFTTVVVFLGQIYGYASMFSGVNLPLHLIIPLAAAAEMIFMSDTVFTAGECLWAMLPPFVYGVGYLGNIMLNGIQNNDWYAFLSWGYPVGIAILAFSCIITWLMALIMTRISLSARS